MKTKLVVLFVATFIIEYRSASPRWYRELSGNRYVRQDNYNRFPATPQHPPKAPLVPYSAFQKVLLQKLNDIIPKTKDDAEANKIPEEIAFVKNIVNLIKLMAIKLIKYENNTKKQAYRNLLTRADDVLQDIENTGNVDNHKLQHISDAMTRLFKPDEKNITQGKSPFCQPGKDCFEDVNHGQIALAIKRLAQGLSLYMKDRSNEEKLISRRNPTHPSIMVKYKTDAILTHLTELIGKLHRSVMRNWHHILMIIANLAGENGGSIRLLEKQRIGPDPEGFKKKKYARSRGEIAGFNDIGSFQCKVYLKGSPKLKVDNSACSTKGKSWFNNKACTSPIKNAKSDCSPNSSGGVLQEIRPGNIAFTVDKSGLWSYKLEILATPTDGHPLNTDLIVGRIDKIIDGQTKPIPLSQINHAIVFQHSLYGQNHVTRVSSFGFGTFNKGDSLLLRMAKAKSNLTFTFSAVFDKQLTNVKLTESLKQDVKPEEFEKAVVSINTDKSDELEKPKEEALPSTLEDEAEKPSSEEVMKENEENDNEQGVFIENGEHLMAPSLQESEVIDSLGGSRERASQESQYAPASLPEEGSQDDIDQLL